MFRDVSGGSGIFRNVPGCSMFLVLLTALQNHTCKPGAIFIAICRCDISSVSNMFETRCNFAATKIASSCRDKNRLCKRALWNLAC